jgi:hypothetical protein
MKFSRTTDGFKVSFALVDKDGFLLTGAVAGDFTATVVNPADSANINPTVSESTQLSGLYTFLVPTSFMTTHGVGEYPVVIQANKTTSPKIDDVFHDVLGVFLEDFDSINLNTGYNGAIHINTKTGAAGAVTGINGTVSNPVSNLADAVTLAAATGLRKYTLVGNITLTSSHDDWVIIGQAAEAAVAIGSQDVADSMFLNCQLSGTINTGPIQAIDCDLDGVGNFTGHAHNCGLVNGTTLGVGTSTFIRCFSAVPGLSTPSIDLNDVASLNMRAYSGGIELRNCSTAGQNVTVELVAGQAVLAATCTDGTISLRGIGNLTDNSAGTTVEKKALISFSAIIDGTATFEEVQQNVHALTSLIPATL